LGEFSFVLTKADLAMHKRKKLKNIR